MPREKRSVGHERGSTEFDRVANFSDAVYAIAMTLLVLEIGVPSLAVDPDGPRVMLDALNDKIPEIVSFAVSFLVIGQYWLNHHRLISKLQQIDRRFISQNLLHLGFIAFLPFPTALIGEYEGNPVSFVTFALAMAAVSLTGVLMTDHADRGGLLLVPISLEIRRWGRLASWLPVGVFLLSIPIAFLNTTAALLSWLVLSPIGFLLNTRMPTEVRSYFEE
jgi:uncharacterized membrane protein